MSYEEENAKLIEAIPEWADLDAREKDMKQVRDYLKSERGYSDSDINNVFTARTTLDLHADWKQSVDDAKQAEADKFKAQLDNPKLSVSSKIDLLLGDDVPVKKPTLRERLYKNNPAKNHPKRSESDRARAINKLLEGK